MPVKVLLLIDCTLLALDRTSIALNNGPLLYTVALTLFWQQILFAKLAEELVLTAHLLQLSIIV